MDKAVFTIKGGDANNVIPDCVKMTGIVLFFKKEQEDFSFFLDKKPVAFF